MLDEPLTHTVDPAHGAGAEWHPKCETSGPPQQLRLQMADLRDQGCLSGQMEDDQLAERH